jgi:hypothetical protein
VKGKLAVLLRAAVQAWDELIVGKLCHLSGCCTKTEVFEQLYYFLVHSVLSVLGRV